MDKSVRERVDPHDLITGMKGDHGNARLKKEQKNRDQENASSMIPTKQTQPSQSCV